MHHRRHRHFHRHSKILTIIIITSTLSSKSSSPPLAFQMVRNVFRKKRYYVGKIPTWADPSEDVTKRKNFKIVKYVFLAPQDDFGMQKKTW